MSIKMKIRRLYITFFACALLVMNNANALDITIEQGVENPIPVAIVPFGWSQATMASYRSGRNYHQRS